MSIFPGFRTARFSLLAILAAFPAFAATGQNLAVLDFKANNTSAGDAAAVSGFVRAAFVKAGAYSVVDKANMDRIMTEQAFQQTGCTDENCAVKLGKLLNVQKMVVGEYTVVGGVRFLTGSLVDVETGKIETTGKVKGFDPGNVDEAAETLAAELMGAPAAPSDSAAPAGAAAHSTRPEASLRAVAAGAATEAEAAKKAEQEAARKEKERIRAERQAAKALLPVDPRAARGRLGIGLNSPGAGLRLLVGSRWLVEARGQWAPGQADSALAVGGRLSRYLFPTGNLYPYLGLEADYVAYESEKGNGPSGYAAVAFAGIEYFIWRKLSVQFDFGPAYIAMARSTSFPFKEVRYVVNFGLTYYF